ncbi:hypothetical protein BXP70_21540 [Hymenobacter crusticola]|uniref:Peptidase M56 domain-containing protein n=2 Tax=Hymenobacter crusticola TaxID=1770526 RepID=A0A243W919_9BACT|nr:hypothetical protein BXP70_21540 [Hymenobacter crusticola]
MWQSTLCLGACWLLYHLALRREACFHYNRWFLRLMPWLALGFPLLPLQALNLGSWLPAATPSTTVAPLVVFAPAPSLSSVVPLAPPDVSAPWPWLALLYGAGVLLWLGRLGWQLAALRRATSGLPQEEEFSYTLVLTSGKLPISSFGKYIFWDETAALTPAEAQQVLHHELAHVQQNHTWEQLHLEVLRALLWFNPFVHLLPRALRLTHEYLADAAVLTAAPDAAPISYTALLARLTLQQLHPRFPLAHSFASSQTLIRIAMLQARSVRSWKRWLVLPLSTVLLITLACAQDKDPVAPIVSGQTAEGKVYTYQQVEQVPIYETGTRKLFEDIIDPIMHSPKYYSKAAIAAHIRGRIIIKFIVTESGSMQNIGIDQSDATIEGPATAVKEIQEKSLAAVQNLPGKWLPGQQAGQTVPVSVMVVCDVNPAYTDTYLSKYPDEYHLTVDWSFNGVDTRSVVGISIPIKESTVKEFNKYAIRPDPSYYKNHKRQ